MPPSSRRDPPPGPGRRPTPGARRAGPAAAAGLLVCAAALALSACAAPSPSPTTGVGCSLTVYIPTAGGTPGSRPLATVTARHGSASQTLRRGTNTVLVACGTRVALRVGGSHSRGRPFTNWVVDGQAVARPAILVPVDGIMSATAAFATPAPPRPSPQTTATATATATPTPTPKPSPTASVVRLDRWMQYDPATRTVTLQLAAGYQNLDYGLNYDGQTKGALAVTVPQGWHVVVRFRNDATSLPHSAAIVTATGTTPVFPGAAVPNPTTGVSPGGSATFSFTTGAPGAYRIACLVPGHEAAGMWAHFTVTAGGLPSIQL